MQQLDWKYGGISSCPVVLTSGGLAGWTSFIFQFILNNGFRLAVRVRVHQIKKIALNYPINIIIFAAPHQHYIMKQRGFDPAPGSSHASK